MNIYNKTNANLKNSIVLIKDNWDDFGYKVSFYVQYVDETGQSNEIGHVRIGSKDNNENLNLNFTDFNVIELSNKYFSLGSGLEYYDNVNKYIKNPIDRNEFFSKMRDIAYDKNIFNEVIKLDVTQNALLRNLSENEVLEKLHSVAKFGENLKSSYGFAFRTIQGEEISFEVDPNSKPSSNTHVIIGSNGNGKTYTIKNIISALYDENNKSEFGEVIKSDNFNFSSVLLVAFSLFDEFERPQNSHNKKMPYSFIGINGSDDENNNFKFINIKQRLYDYFKENLLLIKKSESKKMILGKILDLLNSDSIFNEYNLKEKIFNDFDEKNYFILSSGHKYILTNIIMMVNKIREKTLLIIDEPENHLHPPLLSTFIRIITMLTKEMNGLTIISTHSPVILQEVPKNCIWKIIRSGEEVRFFRPSIETFAENIAKIMDEVFRLEINNSGYINLLKDEISEGKSVEEILDEFSGNIGIQGILLLNSLFELDAGGKNEN